jgi:hypothetical protein
MVKMSYEGDEDILPAPLPQGMVETVDDAIATIAEALNVKPDIVIFKGFSLKFDVNGKPITFDGMRV